MGSDSLPILLLVALLVIFWLVVLRPARRQQQQTTALQGSLEVGDEVVLSAGVFGRIAGLDDQRVRLEVAPGTVIEVARQVVVRRVEPERPDEPAATTDAPDQHDEHDEDKD